MSSREPDLAARRTELDWTDDTTSRTCQIIAESAVVDYSSLFQETLLSDELKLDSLELTEMVVELEQEFDIEFPHDSHGEKRLVDHLSTMTVQGCVDMVKEKRAS